MAEEQKNTDKQHLMFADKQHLMFADKQHLILRT
jgi:hypothetical protein